MVPGGPPGREGAGKDLGELPDVHLGALPIGLPDEVHESRECVGPDHHVDPGGSLLYRSTILLGQASGHNDPHPGVPFLERLQVAQGAVESAVRILPHRARVQNHHLGLGGLAGRAVALGLEHARDAFGVVLVHLAAEGAQQVAAGHFQRL
jgi:hypothetical protein